MSAALGTAYVAVLLIGAGVVLVLGITMLLLDIRDLRR